MEASVRLNWSGDPTFTYRVRYNLTNNNTWYNTTTTGNAITITNLLPASNYRWQVQTVCSDGSSSPATFSVAPYFFFKTGGDACEVPLGLNTVVKQNNETTFSWDPVDGAVNYRIKYNNTINNNWSYLISNTNSITLPGSNFQSNSRYRWSVRSECAINLSDQSITVFYTTASGNSSRIGFSDENEFMSVSPNPFQDYITISTNGNSERKLNIELIDLNGVTQHTEKMNGTGQLSIPSYLASGVYYLRITDSEGQFEFHKIVKQ